MITLRPSQITAAAKLGSALQTKGWGLDASETGCGKTFTAMEVARAQGLKPLVLCPKTTKTGWVRAAEQFGITLEDVLTPEQLRLGRTRWWNPVDKWAKLPKGCMLVWDEVHRGTAGADSKLNEILGQTKPYRVPTLCMSATPASSPLNMRGLGFLADLHKFNTTDFYRWCRENGCYKPLNDPYGRWFFGNTPKHRAIMASIFQRLEPVMVRNRKQDMPDFPECQIDVELVDVLDSLAEINAAYQQFDYAFGEQQEGSAALPVELQSRIEQAKMEVLKTEATDLVAEGNSVVVFFNLRKSVEGLFTELKKAGVPATWMHGELSEEERQEAIDSFQSDQAHVFVVTAECGGPGLNLHASPGMRPRVSLLIPTWNAKSFQQCLGRIHRIGGTKCLQKIILAAGTLEESMYKRMNQHLLNMETLLSGSPEKQGEAK